MSSWGENIIFSDGLKIFDQQNFGVQTQNISYARCPDGSANFDYALPTFNAVNTCLASINELSEATFSIFPNPTSNSFTLQLNENKAVNLKIYDIQGRIVFQTEEVEMEQTIDASNWHSGYYIVSLQTENGQLQTKKLIKN